MYAFCADFVLAHVANGVCNGVLLQTQGTQCTLSCCRCIKVTDTRSKSCTHTIANAHEGCVNHVRWQAIDADLILSCGTDNAICLWDVRCATSPVYTYIGHSGTPRFDTNSCCSCTGRVLLIVLCQQLVMHSCLQKLHACLLPWLHALLPHAKPDCKAVLQECSTAILAELQEFVLCKYARASTRSCNNGMMHCTAMSHMT